MAESQTILVDCITLHHHYRGTLSTNGIRLSDMLSDTRSDFIVLRDVRITAAGHGAPSLECSQLTLQKDRILIAMPQGQDDRPAAQRLDKFQKKDHHGVIAVLPGHILSGVIQLPKASVSWSGLRESGVVQRYFGLTDVTVHNAVFRLTPQTCPLAIIQRDAVEAVELASAPLRETPLAEALAT